MSRSSLVAICTFLLACRTEAQKAPDASASNDAGLSFLFADADPSPMPTASVTVASAKPPDESRLALYVGAVPQAAKSIGHTSVVFRIDFEADGGKLRAAYKPESKRGHKRYRGEVGAYRLAKLLGLPNVPPVRIQVLSRDALTAAAQHDPRAQSLVGDEVIDRKGRVYGSLVPWIDHLEFEPVESPAARAQWEKELKDGGEIPSDRRAIDAQISTLVVFDALTGNWDRWSGANVGIDRKTGLLLFIDNDAAFFDPLPPLFKPQMTLLRGVDRFSRSLVTRLRAISALDLADAFGEEEPGSPLFAPRVVAAADARRRDVLAIIDAKIAALGEPAVLFFP